MSSLPRPHVGAFALVGVMVAAAWHAPASAQSAGVAGNPRPAEGDIVIELPCSQVMTLRRVNTQEAVNDASALLDDRRVLLGRPSVETAYFDYNRQEFISGHFLDGNTRYFLIGKYEVTRAQYQAVMGETCAAAPDDADLPVSEISWYDAVEFTRRLTKHIRSQEAEALAAATGRQDTYIRLPTEAEWEFAARGGLAVSTADFQAERYPMEGDPAAFIWYNSPMSAHGEVQFIAGLEPNPLELYDVYGNVAEMLLDSFRLNKAGRMHGMAGGFIAKGGSYLSQLTEVSSAARREHGYFRGDGADEYKSADVGFRIAAASATLSSRADAAAAQEEWLRATQARLQEGEDPVDQLTALQEGLTDLQLSSDIDAIKRSIRALLSGRNDAQFRLLDGLLLSSGRMIQELRRRDENIKGRQELIEQNLVNAQERAEIERERREDEREILELNVFNHELAVRIANEFVEQEIADRTGVVIAELLQRGFSEDDDLVRAIGLSGKIAGLIASGESNYGRPEILTLIRQETPDW